jgi:hypothetical protein
MARNNRNDLVFGTFSIYIYADQSNNLSHNLGKYARIVTAYNADGPVGIFFTNVNNNTINIQTVEDTSITINIIGW